MKKILKKFIFSIILVASLFALTTQISSAEENSAQVSTQYQLFDELSTNEQVSVIKNDPIFLIDNDFENVTLVYKKNDKKPIADKTNNSGNAVKQNVNNNIKNNSSKKLPATNENKANPLLIVSGFVILVSGVSLIVIKRKQLKDLLLLVIIVGGVGSTIIVNAESESLPKSTVENLSKNTIYNKQKSINGYEYIGYIRNSSNNPKVENGTVTIKYQDVNGNELAADNNLIGIIGSNYEAEQNIFEGYTFERIEGNQTGTFSNENQVVKFIYSKNIETGKIVLQQSGLLPSDEESYYYVATYYDKDGNVLKTEELHGDTTLQNQEITLNLGDSYTVYSYVVFQGYSEETKEQNYLRYVLLPDPEDQELTKGVLTQKLLIINYKFYNNTPV
ncbi:MULTISPECIES: MucBP domain-containing protein [unclassified Enterococcus]|uniref:MucBP domain-containing protein n=1 Tax=unclassified Enterococcus TaxID=2608891 RepID=UPI001556F497|nr:MULTISPECIES: MucBP domain-containing protein [unclassified Enterococcus]MBS7576540.1 MucBP domain-containing protein [Enterococcus sp. MMGLQ5-2]MBS7583973.1 MucBP domain-containing protein [Enterococcus sp. MMGLQ5-1]NPD11834.1 MucBP domain-containing protein [Enterococcus sp. MMGLQ5-1]NPD36377.1 MucBP domain-containing protein [Enterococcus sp. MMGLQ5-2]